MRILTKLFHNYTDAKAIHADFDREVAWKNVQAGRLILPLIVLLQLYNILHVLLFTHAKLATRNNRLYFGMYMILFAGTLASLLFVYIAKKPEERHTKVVMDATFAFCTLLCLWSSGITLLDLHVGLNLSTYSITIIGIGVLAFLRPWQSILLLGGNQLFLWMLVSLITQEPSNYTGAIVNTTALVVIAVGMALVRYRHKESDVKNRYVIMAQNRKIGEINEKLNRLVVTDTLTGLYNRRFFDEVLPAQWQRWADAGERIAVIMLDLDDFKRYNDYYGHQAGDDCIRQLGEVMRNCAAGVTDCLIRYGGEEFTAVLFGSSERQAKKLAEEIRRGVERLDIVHEKALAHGRVTVSAGVFCDVPTETLTLDAFYAGADRALYQAKRAGKNCVKCAWETTACTVPTSAE